MPRTADQRYSDFMKWWEGEHRKQFEGKAAQVPPPQMPMPPPVNMPDASVPWRADEVQMRSDRRGEAGSRGRNMEFLRMRYPLDYEHPDRSSPFVSATRTRPSGGTQDGPPDIMEDVLRFVPTRAPTQGPRHRVGDTSSKGGRLEYYVPEQGVSPHYEQFATPVPEQEVSPHYEQSVHDLLSAVVPEQEVSPYYDQEEERINAILARNERADRMDQKGMDPITGEVFYLRDVAEELHPYYIPGQYRFGDKRIYDRFHHNVADVTEDGRIQPPDHHFSYSDGTPYDRNNPRPPRWVDDNLDGQFLNADQPYRNRRQRLPDGTWVAGDDPRLLHSPAGYDPSEGHSPPVYVGGKAYPQQPTNKFGIPDPPGPAYQANPPDTSGFDPHRVASGGEVADLLKRKAASFWDDFIGGASQAAWGVPGARSRGNRLLAARSSTAPPEVEARQGFWERSADEDRKARKARAARYGGSWGGITYSGGPQGHPLQQAIHPWIAPSSWYD